MISLDAPYPVAAAQRQQFRDDGFIKLPGVFDPATLDIFRDEITRVTMEHNPLANVPRHTLSLWSTLELPRDWEVGGGVRYVGDRTASSTVPLDPVTGRLREVDGYWTLDAMVKYRWSQHLEFQVNVYNLTDNAFYDQVHPGHLVPGSGVSALFSANFKF